MIWVNLLTEFTRRAIITPITILNGTRKERSQDTRIFTRMNERLKLLFQMCVLSDLHISEDRFVRLRSQIATQIIDYI